MMTIDLLTSSEDDDKPGPLLASAHASAGAPAKQEQLPRSLQGVPGATGGGRRSKRAAAALPAAGDSTQGAPGSLQPAKAGKPSAAAARRTRTTTQAGSSKRAAMAPLPLSQSSASEGPTPPPKRPRAGTGAGTGSKQAPLPLRGFGPLDLFMSQAVPSGTATGSSSQATQQQQQQQLQPSSEQSGGTDTGGEGPTAAADATMWVDKHCPACLADLVVHKKKVEEVAAWMDRYLAAAAAIKAGRSRAWLPQVLLVTGPPGCGKSTTVRLLAQERGMEVVEWAAPTPTTWEEYKYQASSGVKYVSKLEEFDMFAVRCKFAALPLRAPPAAATAAQGGTGNAAERSGAADGAGSSQAQNASQQASQQQQQQQQVSQQQQRQQGHSGKLVLLDDLPYAADPQRRQQLADSIRDLAASARCPVVVISTDIGAGGGSAAGRGPQGAGGGVGGSSKGLPKDVLAALTAHGATTITFNPVPPTVVTKALQAICTREGLTLAPATLAALVEAAAGDLRNAVQALQVHCGATSNTRAAGLAAAAAAAAKGRGKGSKRGAKSKAAAGGKEAAGTSHVSSTAARDQQLGVFHALGKLLHNKRLAAPGAEQPAGAATATAAAGTAVPAAQDPEDSDCMIVSQDPVPAEGASSGSSGLGLRLHSRHQRAPLQYDPEAVLGASGLDALSTISFLSSNYLNFMGEEVEEAAEAAEYLSSAGYMACHRATHASSAGFWDEQDTVSSTLLQAAASSVAARGLLYANAHPAPSKWTPVVGPSCNLPEKAAAANLQRVGEVVAAARGALGSACCDGSRAWCSQVLPLLRGLVTLPQYQWVQQMVPGSWTVVWQGSLSERVMHNSSSSSRGGQAPGALPAVVQPGESGEEVEAISDSE